MIFKKFQAVEFGSDEFTERLVAEALPYGGNTSPIARTLDALSCEPLSCKTVIFELDYVDMDYQDEFAAYYSKAFKDYRQRCTRMHFFSVLLPKKQREDFHRYPTNSYLGFIVLRPTDLQRMGRTIIRPTVTNPDSEFITCTTCFEANLYGVSFKVEAMPFLQQDTQVGACAQASLWMLARYMSHKFNYREYLPAEINRLAKAHLAWGRHFPAEKGLTGIQMLDALQGMGLSAISYDKEFLDDYGENRQTGESFEKKFWRSWRGKKPRGEDARQNLIRTAKLADIAYRYIESGLPVIFMPASHALVGIGHKYDYKKKTRLAIQRIPSFFVNDDARGPYLEMPIFSESGIYTSFLKVGEIIVVTPHEATLCGEDAEDLAKDAVRELLKQKSPTTKGKTFKDEIIAMRKEFRQLLSELEFRTYLIRSVDFQKDLICAAKSGDLDKTVAATMLKVDYPKFLWVSEVSSAALLKFENRYQRQCLGRVLIDSTAPKATRGVIAMHLADILAIYDRQGKVRPIRKIIPDSTPFVHKFMTPEIH